MRAATAHTRSDLRPTTPAMLRWLIVILLALIIFSGLRPWLERFGMGKLPGDFRFRLFGRQWFIPLASSVLLSMVALLVGKFL